MICSDQMPDAGIHVSQRTGFALGSCRAQCCLRGFLDRHPANNPSVLPADCCSPCRCFHSRRGCSTSREPPRSAARLCVQRTSPAGVASLPWHQPLSWVREVLGELSLLGVPPPHAYGIHLGSPATSIKPWLSTVKTLLTRHADRHYASLLQECSSFQQYACWQPRHALHRAV